MVWTLHSDCDSGSQTSTADKAATARSGRANSTAGDYSFSNLGMTTHGPLPESPTLTQPDGLDPTTSIKELHAGYTTTRACSGYVLRQVHSDTGATHDDSYPLLDKPRTLSRGEGNAHSPRQPQQSGGTKALYCAHHFIAHLPGVANFGALALWPSLSLVAILRLIATPYLSEL